jgi:GlcNAc-P-P-Und epimerase
MRVLVTGAAGFVGRAIVSELLEKNIEVFCLGNSKSENKYNLPNFLRGDIRNFESLQHLSNLENIDTVIHSAGLAHQFGKTDERDFREINVEGTKNIAQIAVDLKAKHFILISSVAVYGSSKVDSNSDFVSEDFPLSPKGAYAKSKMEAELIAAEICEKNNIPLTILRLATVIGEGDPGNTARLIKAIDNRRFVWIGRGENLKSLAYKNDVAKACLSVLDKKSTKTEIFNVTAEPVKMKEIVSSIAASLNKKVSRITIPIAIFDKIFSANSKIFRSKRLFKLSETVEKWLSSDVFSGKKIADEYGFRAETPISEALCRQVKFYKNRE